MTKIFISYSRRNAEVANYIATELRSRNADVFIDYQKLEASENFISRLGTEIEICDYFVLLVSPEAVKSKWVQAEAAWAFKNQRPIIPIMVKPAPLSDFFFLVNIENIDFTNWYVDRDVEQSVIKLAKALNLPIAKTVQVDDYTSLPTEFEDNEEDTEPTFTEKELSDMVLTASELMDADPEQALFLYQQVLDVAPDYMNGTIQTFVDQQRELVKPIRIERLLESAETAESQRNWDEALKIANSILQLDERHTEAKRLATISEQNMQCEPMYQLARTAYKQERWVSVFRFLTNIRQICSEFNFSDLQIPINSDTASYLGIMYQISFPHQVNVHQKHIYTIDSDSILTAHSIQSILRIEAPVWRKNLIKTHTNDTQEGDTSSIPNDSDFGVIQSLQPYEEQTLAVSPEIPQAVEATSSAEVPNWITEIDNDDIYDDSSWYDSSDNLLMDEFGFEDDFDDEEVADADWLGDLAFEDEYDFGFDDELADAPNNNEQIAELSSNINYRIPEIKLDVQGKKLQVDDIILASDTGNVLIQTPDDMNELSPNLLFYTDDPVKRSKTRRQITEYPLRNVNTKRPLAYLPKPVKTSYWSSNSEWFTYDVVENNINIARRASDNKLSVDLYCVSELPKGLTLPGDSVTFSADGTKACVRQITETYFDIWDLNNLTKIRTLQTKTSGAFGFDSNDENFVLCCNGEVLIGQWEHDEIMKIDGLKPTSSSVTFTVGNDFIRVYSANDNENHDDYLIDLHRRTILNIQTFLASSSDNQWLLYTEKDQIVVYSRDTNKKFEIPCNTRNIQEGFFSDDMNYIYVTGAIIGIDV